MSKKILSLVSLALLGGCALAAQDDPNHASQLVHAEQAALVCTPNQKAHVAIPAGALDHDATITIDAADAPAVAKPYTQVGQGYEFGPSGTRFSSKATVTVTYDPSLLPQGTPLQAIGVLAVSNGTDAEVLPGAWLDTANEKVSAMTSHFTWFAPIVQTNLQVGGPGGTPLFGVATASGGSSMDLWLGPDGKVRSTSNLYATDAPTSVWIKIDTLGALPNTTLHVTQTLEDPSGSGTPWDRITGVFNPLSTTKTDDKGVLVYVIDGHMLQDTVTQIVQGAPGYPSGRVHLVIDAPQPIDLWISLALHPQAQT